jgi:hypothetical protein
MVMGEMWLLPVSSADWLFERKLKVVHLFLLGYPHERVAVRIAYGGGEMWPQAGLREW